MNTLAYIQYLAFIGSALLTGFLIGVSTIEFRRNQ